MNTESTIVLLDKCPPKKYIHEPPYYKYNNQYPHYMIVKTGDKCYSINILFFVTPIKNERYKNPIEYYMKEYIVEYYNYYCRRLLPGESFIKDLEKISSYNQLAVDKNEATLAFESYKLRDTIKRILDSKESFNERYVTLTKLSDKTKLTWKQSRELHVCEILKEIF